MVFSDQKCFKTSDVACKDFHLGSILETKDPKLPKHIWVAKGSTAYVVLAVALTAIREILQVAKEVCVQYPRADLKMVIFTPNEMKLWEGAELQEKLGLTLTSILLASRQLSLCGEATCMPGW